MRQNRRASGMVVALAATLVACAGSIGRAQLIETTWIGAADGDWSDGGRWTGGVYPTQRGSTRYRAIVDATGGDYVISLDSGLAGNVVLAELELASAEATIDGAGTAFTVRVEDTARFRDAMLLGVARFVSAGELIFAGDVCDDICDTPLDHTGSRVDWSTDGDIRVAVGSVFTHGAMSTFDILGAGNIAGDGTGTLINNGKINKGSAVVTTISGVTFENNGTVCVTAGTLRIVDPSLLGVRLQRGAWTIEGATLDIDMAAYSGLDGEVLLDGAGSVFSAIDGLDEIGTDGLLKIRNGRDFVTMPGPLTVDGALRIGESGLLPSVFTVGGPLTNNGSVRLAPGAGTLVVFGGQAIGNNGQLGGSGQHIGAVTNNGEVDPGPDGTEGPDQAGQLEILDGAFEQGEDGRVKIEIGGPAPVLEHDVLRVQQALFDPTGDQRAGTLEVRLINGFLPAPGEVFAVMQFDRRIGEFERYEFDPGVVFEPLYTDQSLLLTVIEASVCYPDCDGTGTLDFFDFLCFQNAFALGDPYADCDGTGVLDFFDFLCFQNEFARGCG